MIASEREDESTAAVRETVRVFCRLRPDLPEDNGPADTSELYLTASKAIDLPGSGARAVVSHSEDGKVVYHSPALRKDSQFQFQGCFGPASSQHDVYLTAVKPLVDSALRGYSATVMNPFFVKRNDWYLIFVLICLSLGFCLWAHRIR